MTLSPKEITDLIKKKLPDAIIDLDDLKGDNNHYHAKIISSKFKGLSKLKQHKLVYSALGSHMGNTLHALMLETSDIKKKD
jgi:stress-induced morphogen